MNFPEPFITPENIQIAEAPWLIKANSFIAFHLDNPDFNLNHLSEYLRTSPRNLQYQMKKHTGFSAKKYVTEIRLLTAEQLLKESTLPTVKDVCLAVGFLKPTYFSKLFKKRFGKLPSEYLNG